MHTINRVSWKYLQGCRLWAEKRGSEWIKTSPELATSKCSQWKAAFGETSAVLLGHISLYEMLRANTSYQSQERNSPVPNVADKQRTSQRTDHLMKPKDGHQPQGGGGRGLGTLWLSDAAEMSCSSTAQFNGNFSVVILLQQRSR